jgi:hypothetical protein
MNFSEGLIRGIQFRYTKNKIKMRTQLKSTWDPSLIFFHFKFQFCEISDGKYDFVNGKMGNAIIKGIFLNFFESIFGLFYRKVYLSWEFSESKDLNFNLKGLWIFHSLWWIFGIDFMRASPAHSIQFQCSILLAQYVPIELIIRDINKIQMSQPISLETDRQFDMSNYLTSKTETWKFSE